MSSFPSRGLYAITDRELCGSPSIEQNVELAIQGGAVVIQYRDKGTDKARRKAEACRLLEVCRAYQVALIINDDIDLAADIGAQGVHVGKDDGTLAQARAALGSDAIVGVSCYNSIEKAVAAEAAGADYVAFGRFFPSPTKPDASPATLKELRANRARLGVPVVAIGGINSDNAQQLLDAGADLLAVINAVFGTGDPRAAASRFSHFFLEP